ncbi:hypothetical protein Y032_0251g175 [Ancylostoma ceylanicum]|nr:hypothetical protein Y032_0251g175 [Ancylostoma ceylanicum]
MIGFHALRPFFPVFRLLHPCRTAHNLNEIMTSFWLPTLRSSPVSSSIWIHNSRIKLRRVYQLRKRASLTLELYRQAQANASLIGTLEPPVTPTCLNSNGVNHIVHGLFVLSAIGFKRNDHHCL